MKNQNISLRYTLYPLLIIELQHHIMQGRIFETGDGSPSIFSEQFGVSYHSMHGAIQETEHVFIEAGLRYRAAELEELSILGIGMGTGLNAYMTYLEAERQQLKINYVTIEAFPLEFVVAEQLNYAELLGKEDTQALFLTLHEAAWGKTQELSPCFKFTKWLKRFEEIDFMNQFDVIYFDAFAPNAQPELWEADLLTKMYHALKPNGVLVTYCAKGVVKRTLKAIGFEVQAIPGPPRKREMTRAVKGS